MSNLSIKSSEESDKSNGESNGGAAPRRFDDMGEFLAYAQAHEASEVLVSVTTEPPVMRDPRADVYHALLEARIMEPVIVKARGKDKVVKQARTVTFCTALDLLVVDEIAQTENFGAMTDKALAPIVAGAKLAGLDVRRGRLSR
jgi:hypothetical protein